MHPLKIALALVLVPAIALAQGKSKKQPKLSAVFENARYVYVEAIGGQEFDPRLDTDDRQAIADVDEALNKWDRYVLTMQRDHADLIFVVRKGRLAEARVGVQVGSGRQTVPRGPVNGPLPGSGVAVGGEAGPPDDLLEVYLPNPNDARGTLVWQHTLRDGLNGPELALFKQLKHEVESTYPKQTTSTKSKP